MGIRSSIHPLIHCATVLCLCVLAALLPGGEAPAEAPDDLPPSAKRAISAAETAIAKARAAYLATAKREQDKLLTALQREQEAQTRAGKLEAALAVKGMADRVRSGEYQKELDDRAADTDDLLGEGRAAAAPSLARHAGTWRAQFSNGWRRMVTINADGTCTVLRSDHLPENASYTLRWDAKANGFVTQGLGAMLEVYRITGDTLACDHWCNAATYGTEGANLTAQFERVPPHGSGPPAIGSGPPSRR